MKVLRREKRLNWRVNITKLRATSGFTTRLAVNPRPTGGVRSRPPLRFFWNNFRTNGGRATIFCIAEFLTFLHLESNFQTFSCDRSRPMTFSSRSYRSFYAAKLNSATPRLNLNNSETIKFRAINFLLTDSLFFHILTELSLVGKCDALWRIWRNMAHSVFVCIFHYIS